MAIVLEVSVTLNPNNQIAYLGDFTGLVVDTEYIINGTYITYDTRFTFRGNLDITLTKPPIAVPTSGTVVPAEITTVPEAAPPPPPVKYPYSAKDRLSAINLNIDFEFSPGPVPPNSALGGAGMYKYWVDTSVTPAVLRQCRVARASTSYVAGQWITIATIDAVNGIYNPAGGLSNGGTVNGSITIVGSETITGNFAVSGNTNISGNTTLGGPLTVNNLVSTNGSNAQFVFYDITRPSHFWTWWAGDDGGHLDAYTPTGRQILIINGVTGDVNMGAGSFYAPGSVSAGSSISTPGPLGSLGGIGSGVYFSDRNDGSYRYLVYGQGENLYFYNERRGYALGYFDAAGGLVVRGNLACGQVTSSYLYTAGTVQGSYIVSTGNVQANGSLTTSNNVSAAGNISCNGSMWMWDVNSGGTINSQYGSFSQQVSANVLQANYIHSNGTVRGDGGLYTGGPIEGNTVHAFGSVTADYNLYVSNLFFAQWGVIYGPISNGAQVGFGWGLGVGLDLYANASYQWTIWSSASDQRLKTNIAAPEADAIDVLRALKLSSYDRTDQDRPRFRIGLVAQQVQELIPEAVIVGPTECPKGGTLEHPGLLHLDPNPILAYAIRAIQQLTARVEALEGAAS